MIREPNAQACRIGYIGSLVATIVGYAYLLGYILLLALYPVQPWNGIESFARSLPTPYGTALTILQILAFFQTLSITITVIAIAQSAAPHRRVFGKMSEVAVTSFMALSCLHYFIQWAAVRPSILKGNLDGLSQFVQFNFDSPLSAINMLGWTLFYGLAALSISALFHGKGRFAWVRWGFVACGINGIVSAIGLAAGKQITYLFWTIGVSITWYVYPLIMGIFREWLSEPTTRG
jgi:hypothetical protein